MPDVAKILFCRCAYFDVMDRSVVDEALERLVAAGADVTVVEDLCELAARKDPLLAELAGGEGLTVVACFPRAVRALFAAAGTKLPGSARVVNMRGASAEQIVRETPGEVAADGQAPESTPASCEEPDWRPWFPVIDRDRCVNCRQCLNFCLFGVYAADEDGCVRVVKPASCKTFCPACARICPSAAIIFPKFADGPINGDEVTTEHLKEQKVGINPSALAGGDVHSALRRRSGAEDGESFAAARARLCAGNVVKDLNIPPEVLESVQKEFAARKAGAPPRDETKSEDGQDR